MHLDNERVTLKAQWPAKSLNESVDRFLLLYQEIHFPLVSLFLLNFNILGYGM